jgi:serine/threonine-protein kinase
MTESSSLKVVRCIDQSANCWLLEVVNAAGERNVVKALRPGADQLTSARFAREFAVLSALRHENLVPTFTSIDEFDGHFVMPLLEGASLRTCLDRGGPMPRATAFHIAFGLLAGLAELHKAGIIHRDVKPANVFYGRVHHELIERNRAILLDLGIARNLSAPLTAEGMVLGTPSYFAPEQLFGASTDARTDLYAVGLLLFELLVAERFHDHRCPSQRFRDRYEALSREAKRRLVGLTELLEVATADDPRRRFQSCEQMSQALVQLRRAS